MGVWRRKEVIYTQGKKNNNNKNIQLKVGSQLIVHGSCALRAKQIPIARIYSRFLF